MTKQNKNLLFLIFGTVLALVPSYVIRYKESVYMWFYTKLTTYPGDLWNFWTNYLQKGAHFPPEYPVGLRFFYELFGFYKYQDYSWFFTINAIILALFAIGTSYLLWKIIHNSKFIIHNSKNIWYFWILAPSFIFYSLLNYDLLVVFLIVLAVYLFLREKYYGAIVSLAVGTVLKVFPMFLLPIFILKSPKKDWFNLGLLFVGIIIVLNLPYMLKDFSGWIFPYTWQIGQNLSKDPSAGTYWWLIYPILKNYTGWFSLLLFGGLYIFTYQKLKNTTFTNFCLAVILIFLLTDRIYSPQYNLYLLPFLALATYKINKSVFYVMDILNVCVVFFCFFLKDNPIYLQILVFLRYGALVWLYIDNWRKSLSNKSVD